MKTTSAIEHRILHGLHLEWENVLTYTEIPYKNILNPPLFSLKNSKKSLAHWNPVKREISFSREFVLNHPWDAIKEVLVHEMAHQYAHEILDGKNEPPHGDSFKKACKLFRADPQASGSYKTLTERLNSSELSENDRILLKVQKLLALGNSMNRNEAESAIAKAYELIEKYNIEIFEKNEDRSFISTFVGCPSLLHNRHDYMLANLLVEHYFVYGIWITAYVIDKGKMGRVFEITGTLENVKIAEYVYDFIHNHAKKAWDEFGRGIKTTRFQKSDFYTGLITGFKDRLKKERAARNTLNYSPADNNCIVPLDPKLSEYTAYRYPRVKNRRTTKRSVDKTVFNAGNDIGKELVLTKAVESSAEKNIRRLIEGQ